MSCHFKCIITILRHKNMTEGSKLSEFKISVPILRVSKNIRIKTILSFCFDKYIEE
jgi:Pyruvate/2-oxoacid:ferredoxin oxidoreductase delta subunit